MRAPDQGCYCGGRSRRVAYHLLEQVAEAAVPSHPEWVIKTSRRETEAIMDRGEV